MMADCVICDNTGWVCENHRDRPWKGSSDREDACDCGAGTPCVCNDAPVPRKPPGMRTTFDRNGWWH
jgi:hypothetical protein